MSVDLSNVVEGTVVRLQNGSLEKIIAIEPRGVDEYMITIGKKTRKYWSNGKLYLNTFDSNDIREIL